MSVISAGLITSNLTNAQSKLDVGNSRVKPSEPIMGATHTPQSDARPHHSEHNILDDVTGNAKSMAPLQLDEDQPARSLNNDLAVEDPEHSGEPFEADEAVAPTLDNQQDDATETEADVLRLSAQRELLVSKYHAAKLNDKIEKIIEHLA